MVEYIWENKDLLRIRYSGIVTGDELIRSALENAGDSRFDYIHHVVGDWVDYIKTEIDQDDVVALTTMMKTVTQICPNVKNATVIRPDKTGNALVAFYKILCRDISWEIGIFHTFDDAFKWFDIPMPDHLKDRVVYFPE